MKNRLISKSCPRCQTDIKATLPHLLQQENTLHKDLASYETLGVRIQLVPYEIHENIAHKGCVALFRALFL